MLEIKKTLTEMKNSSFWWAHCKLEIAGEIFSVLQDMSIETFRTKYQTEKRLKKMEKHR